MQIASRVRICRRGLQWQVYDDYDGYDADWDDWQVGGLRFQRDMKDLDIERYLDRGRLWG